MAEKKETEPPLEALLKTVQSLEVSIYCSEMLHNLLESFSRNIQAAYLLKCCTVCVYYYCPFYNCEHADNCILVFYAHDLCLEANVALIIKYSW